jgi:hypothetical protein
MSGGGTERSVGQQIAGLRMLWTAMQTTEDFETCASLWRASRRYVGSSVKGPELVCSVRPPARPGLGPTRYASRSGGPPRLAELGCL